MLIVINFTHKYFIYKIKIFTFRELPLEEGKIIQKEFNIFYRNRLTNEQLKALSLDAKLSLISHLIGSHSGRDDKQTAKNILLAIDPKELTKIIDQLGLKTLQDKLGNKDMTEILKLANKS